MRAGAFGMSLLADPLNVSILEALSDGPLDLPTLRCAAAKPAPTTLRTHIRDLAGLGLIERTISEGFARSVSHELTPSGHELLTAARLFRRWLDSSPDGSVPLESSAGKKTIRALAEGWSTTILRALAAKPLSLTELDQSIVGANYPALERRLVAMREEGQIAPIPGVTPTRYALTKWMREAVAPILAVSGWEDRRELEATDPLARIDTEGIFLLAVPLMDAPNSLTGTCRLAIEIDNGLKPDQVGVVICLSEGRAISYRSDQRAEAHAWATGSIEAWTKAIGLGQKNEIEVGGDRTLATEVVTGLSRTLRPHGRSRQIQRA
jgi:DNA-binding HxlR family transcriptional regulator